MGHRITIMLDEDLEKKIRIEQSKVILKQNKNYSFSQALNDYLRGKFK